MPPRDLRRDVGKEARLWGMAVVCAAAGAIAVSITDSFWIGVLVFLAVLGICGPILFTYEKRKKARTAGGESTSGSKKTDPSGPKPDRPKPDRPKHGGHRKRPPRR